MLDKLRTATAAVAGLVALSDLLRGEDVGDTKSAHGIRFDLLGGREGPTGAAVALILNRGGELACPIDQTSRHVWLSVNGDELLL